MPQYSNPIVNLSIEMGLSKSEALKMARMTSQVSNTLENVQRKTAIKNYFESDEFKHHLGNLKSKRKEGI